MLYKLTKSNNFTASFYPFITINPKHFTNFAEFNAKIQNKKNIRLWLHYKHCATKDHF